MIHIEQRPEGVILAIRAHAGARRNEVGGEQDGALRVHVTQAPERGKANKAILELLAKHLKLKKSRFEVVSGQTSPQKRVLIRNLTAGELAARLSPEPPQ